MTSEHSYTYTLGDTYITQKNYNFKVNPELTCNFEEELITITEERDNLSIKMKN